MAKKSHAYSLGVYLAEYIMLDKMPSLSCYQWTNIGVQVTSGEADETKRLSDVWFSRLNEEQHKLTKGLKGAERYKKEKEAQNLVKDEWNADMKYRYMLKEKYLPHTLKCVVYYVDFSDEETNKEIKRGFIASMWDSDHCEYSLKEEDITFENEIDTYGDENQYKMSFTHVTMKLDLEAPSSYTGDDWIEIKTPQKQI
jgi:hypothetical protein